MIIHKYFNYFVLFLSTLMAIKTAPSALHHYLFLMNIENVISLDVSSCESLAYSSFAVDFNTPLFKFSILIGITHLVVLLRKREWSLLNMLNSSYLIVFVLIGLALIIFNCGELYYFDWLCEGKNIFQQHIIYIIAYLICILTIIYFLILFLLVLVDKDFTYKIKFFLISLICFCSIFMSLDMLIFIHLYAVMPENPAIFAEACAYTLSTLGLGVLCMDNGMNPCAELLKQAREVCQKTQGVQQLPRIPGGPPSTREIRTIMNILRSIWQYNEAANCNDARKKFVECMQAANKKK